MQLDRLYTHATLVATESNRIELIPDQALGIHEGRIVWRGKMQALKEQRQWWHIAEEIDLTGRYLLPGLIDCHTHLVYAGDRMREFALRMQGQSYTDIARQGGGILSTVQATAAASEEELFTLALTRLKQLKQQGVTGVEIKSGYGLEVAAELKLLRVIQRLKQESGLRIHATLLAAHAIPPAYAGDRAAYISQMTQELIPEAARLQLADSVDAFCESIGLNLQETEQLFQAAQRHSLPVRLHAEQLSAMGGSRLAARYQALSVDHLEYLTEADVAALAESGTVAVLLPGAYYYLRESRKPPVDLLRRFSVPIAIATDHNPGTSPTLNLRLMLNMACLFFGLMPEEALLGATRNAALALGWEDAGGLEIGMRADITILDEHPFHWLAQF